MCRSKIDLAGKDLSQVGHVKSSSIELLDFFGGFGGGVSMVEDLFLLFEDEVDGFEVVVVEDLLLGSHH